jgi:hypothetical protein
MAAPAVGATIQARVCIERELAQGAEVGAQRQTRLQRDRRMIGRGEQDGGRIEFAAAVDDEVGER